MKSNRLALLLLVVFLCWLPTVAQGQETPADPDLVRLMADLGAEAEQGRRIAYREEKHYAFLEQVLASNGMLSFHPPDILVREVLAPDPARYTIDGSRLIMEEAGRERREINLGDYPQAAVFIEALRAVLAGDLSTLARHFRVQLTSGHTRWSLQLIPLDKEIAKVVESIVLTGRSGLVLQVRTNEAGGDYTLMILTAEADG